MLLLWRLSISGGAGISLSKIMGGPELHPVASVVQATNRIIAVRIRFMSIAKDTVANFKGYGSCRLKSTHEPSPY
jgi:hypothetical protein